METRNCQNCKIDFDIEEEDFSFYEKMKVPAPFSCPDCRFKMRAVWRNEISLYSGQKCGLCNKSIVSMYNPNGKYLIYCNTCYRGDGWDFKSYAMDYDFDKTFFEQLNELILKVPKNALLSVSGAGQNLNSEFTNSVGGLKNCFFCFNCAWVDDSQYCRGVTSSKEIFDSYFCDKLDCCYENVNTQQCSSVTHAQNAVSCINSHFILNVSGLTNCFGCVNIRNKSNCFFNEQLTPEEYKSKVKEIFGSYKKMIEFNEEFKKLCLNVPHRATHNVKALDSIGDYLSECKNLKYSFEIVDGENSKWVFSSRKVKDSYGTIGYAIKSEQLLEVVSTGASSHVIGSWACDLSSNLEYCASCFPSNSDLVGCDSMKNSQYCILNKQYSKEEYEKVRNHIISELISKNQYGLMLPPGLCPFAYNETVAQDNMPLSEEQAVSEGFKWEDNIQTTKGKETMQPEEIPDHIKDIPGHITSEVLKCVSCERNYKINDQELLFYRKMNLPIPRKCFYCRHKDRIVLRGPYQFWKRNCDLCKNEIMTNFSPDRKEIIYCESCYQKEVY